MKLTIDMLDVIPDKNGTDCSECPIGCLSFDVDVFDELIEEKGTEFCCTHKITLKP